MKYKRTIFGLSVLVFFGSTQIIALAQWQSQSQAPQNIRAHISGGGGSGKCTFEVVIDGTGDVEIRGDEGQLVWVSGGPVSWRRLDCNQPLPRNPINFQFHGVDGRGTQTLVRDPASNNGIAIIRLDDPQNGSEAYTGDITWTGGDNDSGGWNNGAYPNEPRQTPGYQAGYRDGSTDGQNDRSANRPLKYGPGYNHPDRGYQNSYGDKKTYEQQYRDGYQQGYQEVYNGGEHQGSTGNYGNYTGPQDYGHNQNPGYQAGYRDGSTDGQNDHNANRPLQYGPGYNHPDRGYQNSYGDKKTYEQQYRSGYERGYQQAYNGGYPRHTDRGSHWDTGRTGGYGNQAPGYQTGYRDGSTDGQNDRRAGRPLKYGPGYNHPDRGYQNSYGDKKTYEQQYRDGYQRGYQEGYNGPR